MAMKKSVKTGRDYCFQPDRICFRAGSDLALLGANQYRLGKPAVMQVEEQDRELYIPADDLVKLLAPDFNYELKAEQRRVVLYHGGETHLAWKYIDMGDGVLGLGIKNALHDVLEMSCNFLGHNVCIVRPDVYWPDPNDVLDRKLLWSMGEKHVGELFRTIWLPQAGRMNSYRLYVPSTWSVQPEKKMVVCLHGAGGNENNCFDRSEGKLSYYAEKYGYLVLAPNSLVVRSNYGGNVPPSGQFPTPKFTDEQGKPQYYSREDLEENALAEACVMEVVRTVMEEFGVDKNMVYLMGNSMGGIGTFHLGNKYGELFRALAPAGALPEPKEVVWSEYGQKPILFVAGTEDHNGFEQMVADFNYIRDQGVNIRMLPVGGGPHPTAWTWELPEIFSFFDNN